MNRQEIELIIKKDSLEKYKDYKDFMKNSFKIDEELFKKYFASSKENTELLGAMFSFKKIIILFLDIDSVLLYTYSEKLSSEKWNNYQTELKSVYGKYNCIVCGKEIKKVNNDDINLDEDDSTKWWFGGAVDKIVTGYGSNFDGDIYSFGICDDCIEKKSKDGTIKFKKRYFH